MLENLAGFSGDQLQFIGALVVTFGSGFVVMVWRVAVWKSKIENDLDNFGFILKTEKGLARREKKLKQCKEA